MYYKLLSFDLSAQDYSSASAVENVASTIKSLVASYYSEPIRLKKFNVSYTFADGTVRLRQLLPVNHLVKSLQTQRPSQIKTVLTVYTLGLITVVNQLFHKRM